MKVHFFISSIDFIRKFYPGDNLSSRLFNLSNSCFQGINSNNLFHPSSSLLQLFSVLKPQEIIILHLTPNILTFHFHFYKPYTNFRLKELVPSVSAKDNVTQLDIILEAIRYIDSLQNRLADKLENGDIELVQVPVNNLKE